MFEYKNDVAILHGAFLSASEQLKPAKQKDHVSQAGFCKLSETDAMRACKIIARAVSQIENVREGLTPQEIDEIHGRLHSCILFSLLSFNGYACPETTCQYFEAIENIFPPFDFKFYCSLLKFVQWHPHLNKSVSCLQDDLCLAVLREILDFICESERGDLVHCIQETIIKKYSAFIIDESIDFDRYEEILVKTDEIFLSLWQKCLTNDSSFKMFADLYAGCLVTLRTMCDLLFEQLLDGVPEEKQSSKFSQAFYRLRIVTGEIYLVVTRVDKLRAVLGAPEQLCDTEDWIRVSEAIRNARESLELFLRCAKYYDTSCDAEEIKKLKTIRTCLRKLSDESKRKTNNAEIERELKQLEGLKRMICAKDMITDETNALGQLYSLVEDDTLCKLMTRGALSENDDRLRLVEMLLSNCYHLPISRQQNILRIRLEIAGLSDVLKLPDFNCTTFLNQAAKDRKDIFQEVLKLSLQSPEETIRQIVTQAVTNFGQIEISVQMLKVLYPVCRFRSGGSDCSLLVCCLKEILLGNLTEKQFQNVLTITKNLLCADENQSPLNASDMLTCCILPNLNTKTAVDVLDVLLEIFQHICGLSTQQSWIEIVSASAVVVCLCHLIDLYVYEGDGGRKGKVIETLTLFKNACNKPEKCNVPLNSLSSVGKLHALKFFNSDYTESKLPLLLMAESENCKAHLEKLFSDVKPSNRYPLLVAVFVQILPHATPQEWEMSCSSALTILSDESVLEQLKSHRNKSIPTYNSENFLVMCVSDALILILEQRQAPISWTHVLYCYSVLLKGIRKPECVTSVLYEACRLTSSLSNEVGNLLTSLLLELVQSVQQPSEFVRRVVDVIPHEQIRTNLAKLWQQ